MQPSTEDFSNAAQTYPFAEGALYQVYTAPGRVTDIRLEAGESLSGSGPVAAGDTARWIIGDTVSGSGPERRVHILVKPSASDLRTNLVINTDRRTYHIELRATPASYMAAVAWRYPSTARAAAPAAAPPAVAALHLDYRIVGDRPAWRPVRVFDDGRQTVVEFPEGVAQTDLPPLFILNGRAPELVNYRVIGRRMIVDRLFETAELRLGVGRGAKTVRILRIAGR